MEIMNDKRRGLTVDRKVEVCRTQEKNREEGRHHDSKEEIKEDKDASEDVSSK